MGDSDGELSRGAAWEIAIAVGNSGEPREV